MKQHLILIIVFLWACGPGRAQIITTIAGTGTRASTGDGGPAVLAALSFPSGVAVDSAGNVFVTEAICRVRKINTAGIITTIAGSSAFGYSGDGGPATAARLGTLGSICFDGRGNLYINDGYYCVVRKIDTAGIITTVAGTGTCGYSGDDSAATSAEIAPSAICVDSAGDIYIACVTAGTVVRKVSVAGIITTIAGTGTPGFSGDGGAARFARLNNPGDLSCDPAGNLYICDARNLRIRKVDTSGIITTVAGNGDSVYSGDGGAATAAGIAGPSGITADAYGNLYITDLTGSGTYPGDSRVRKVNAAGIITTIAGNGVSSFSGDGGLAVDAELDGVSKAARNKNGDLYIADRQNQRIRRVSSRPYFVNGSAQAVADCGGIRNIDTLLSANDSNSGNPERWSIVAGPYHGTAVATYTAVSTGHTVIPSGLSYTPATGFLGTDTLLVRITDSLVADTTTLYLTTGRSPGPIAGTDTVCRYRSETLSDTSAGGTWRVSNSNATISPTGSITGVLPGTDTVSYTLPDNCPVSYTVIIKNCNEGVAAVPTAQAELCLCPNPSDGTFTLTISSPIKEQAHAIITDIAGSRIKELSLTTNIATTVRLDVPDGVYFITVATGEGSYRDKIVVGR